MKRILSVITTIILAMTMATAMFAQSNASDKPLTPNQWKRGIAILAQNAALDGRYGHPESEFPTDYSLDDLNKVYKNSKWKAVYAALKDKEASPSTMQALKDIAKEYTQPNGVERKLNDYIASHPEKQTPESPSATVNQPQPEANQPQAEQADTDAAQPDSIMVINASADSNKATTGSGVGMVIDIILFIIAALALYLAWVAKRENAELKKELDYKTNKMASQFEKFSKNITTDLNRVTYKVNKRRTNDSEGTISFNDATDGAPLADEPVVEPKKLFLSKPDANDYFMRATDEIEVGNSIYELCTFDGITGTYRVIDSPDVHHFALMMPTENLVRACTGNGIQLSNGKTRIITDRDGTARCENGRWHVAVKAIIHYEA
ncbi:MAG: hypothetical protein ACI30V_04055 [Muribaculaceae bacterium]